MGKWSAHYKRHFETNEAVKKKLEEDGVIKGPKKTEAKKPDKPKKKEEDK